jgi:hypothetical protein
MNVDKVVELVKESEECKQKGTDLMNKSKQILAEARELCPHPATTEKEHYYSGGYMDHAATTTTTYCAICGKQLGTEVVEHSWYG